MRALLAFLLLLVPTAAAAQQEGFIPTDDGVRLFYRIEGRGPQTLIVVHGGPGFSLESVRADFAPLARNRRVIYYDQRGNGRSSLADDPAKLAISHHIADLEAVRRHFGLEKLVLLGNSWGSLLISYYAVAHPDRVERMVLDAPAPPTRAYYLRFAANISARTARMSEAVQARLQASRPGLWFDAEDPIAVCRAFTQLILRAYVFDPAAALPVRSNLCAGSPEAVRRTPWAGEVIRASLGEYDLRADVRRVTAPVLVIHGVADPIPIEGSRDWAAGYPGARLLLMHRSGHLMHVEEPEAFFAAVETFLAGRWPAAAARVP
ncbi:MAG TPA: alpha/beta hydrolase [Allosphingosinicella sp.]|nr:alpha/beta hydrolase [Allosphingosinicella sp.]